LKPNPFLIGSLKRLMTDQIKENSVISKDETYISGIKIYSTGIKEDPIPGEKRGFLILF
jgi:hypothetical protein